jgi:hypothetical protein
MFVVFSDWPLVGSSVVSAVVVSSSVVDSMVVSSSVVGSIPLFSACQTMFASV